MTDVERCMDGSAGGVEETQVSPTAPVLDGSARREDVAARGQQLGGSTAPIPTSASVTDLNSTVASWT